MNTTSPKSQKTRSFFAYVIEGPLYEIMAEDGPATTFTCSIGARLADGREFAHDRLGFIGHGKDDEGLTHVFQSRLQAQRIADKINHKGEIDLQYWSEVEKDPRSLEERWADDAANEDLERRGLIPAGSNFHIYHH